jgi:hypothetical protein
MQFSHNLTRFSCPTLSISPAAAAKVLNRPAFSEAGAEARKAGAGAGAAATGVTLRGVSCWTNLFLLALQDQSYINMK